MERESEAKDTGLIGPFNKKHLMNKTVSGEKVETQLIGLTRV